MTEMNETTGGGAPASGDDARDEWLRRHDRLRDERLGRCADDRDERSGTGEAADGLPDALSAVAGEARRLFGSLQQRVGREIGKGFVRGGVGGLGHGLGQAIGADRKGTDVWGEAVSGHDDDEYICHACPVCRLKAARRDAGGDVTDHLIAAGGELIAAFRQAVDAVSRPATPRRPGDTQTRVEHIDLG